MRLIALGIVIAVLAAPLAAPAGPIIKGKTFARVSVTVDPDKRGTILVPSPFTILPGAQRVAIHVPEAGGILLLEGDRILHHFPLEVDVVHDLESTTPMLVAGQRHPFGQFTVTLDVFDFETGRKLDRFASANPYLRVATEGESLWRVVLAGSRAGVYHPPAGASYPLWDRESGVIASSEQIARASSGVGFGGETAWIPHPDGSISRRHRGQTEIFAGSDRGEFIDPVSGSSVLLLQPEVTVRSDADGDFLLPGALRVRVLTEEERVSDSELASIGAAVHATRLVIQGRPVRVHEGKLYWIFLGHDFLEIRVAPIEELG